MSMTFTTADLEANGFLMRDDFLPRPLFEQLKARVLAAWEGQQSWQTKVKGPGAPVTLPLQDHTKLNAIGKLLDAERAARPDGFTYMYHVAKEEQAAPDLAAEVTPYLIEGWADMLDALGIAYRTTQFALTAFGPHCYLDSHTDFTPTDAAPYQVALILYFHAAGSGQGGFLEFDYMGKRTQISAMPNRSVFFIPNQRTRHCVPQLAQEGSVRATPRLAVSGWLI